MKKLLLRNFIEENRMTIQSILFREVFTLTALCQFFSKMFSHRARLLEQVDVLHYNQVRDLS